MPRHTLGDLQHAIMAVLWERGEATAASVHEALREERGLAPTTIATMLRKMEDKGIVAHRAEGRQFVYRPTVTEELGGRPLAAPLPPPQPDPPRPGGARPARPPRAAARPAGGAPPRRARRRVRDRG